MLTAAAIADRLLAADRGAADPALTLRQVRNFATRGLLPGARQIDDRGTKAFAAEAVFAARIFQVATLDLGLDSTALEPLRDALHGQVNAAEMPPSMLDTLNRDALACAIRGVEAGEPWFVRVRRNTEVKTGERRWTAAVTPDDFTFHAPGMEDALASRSGAVVRATSLISLNATFAGLPKLAELKAE